MVLLWLFRSPNADHDCCTARFHNSSPEEGCRRRYGERPSYLFVHPSKLASLMQSDSRHFTHESIHYTIMAGAWCRGCRLVLRLRLQVREGHQRRLPPGTCATYLHDVTHCITLSPPIAEGARCQEVSPQPFISLTSDITTASKAYHSHINIQSHAFSSAAVCGRGRFTSTSPSATSSGMCWLNVVAVAPSSPSSVPLSPAVALSGCSSLP